MLPRVKCYAKSGSGDLHAAVQAENMPSEPGPIRLVEKIPRGNVSPFFGLPCNMNRYMRVDLGLSSSSLHVFVSELQSHRTSARFVHECSCENTTTDPTHIRTSSSIPFLLAAVFTDATHVTFADFTSMLDASHASTHWTAHPLMRGPDLIPACHM